MFSFLVISENSKREVMDQSGMSQVAAWDIFILTFIIFLQTRVKRLYIFPSLSNILNTTEKKEKSTQWLRECQTQKSQSQLQQCQQSGWQPEQKEASGGRHPVWGDHHGQECHAGKMHLYWINKCLGESSGDNDFLFPRFWMNILDLANEQWVGQLEDNKTRAPQRFDPFLL